MELTVSRPPVYLAMQNVATSGEPDYRMHQEQFLARLKALISAANDNLCLAQARYNADFDKTVRRHLSEAVRVLEVVRSTAGRP